MTKSMPKPLTNLVVKCVRTYSMKIERRSGSTKAATDTLTDIRDVPGIGTVPLDSLIFVLAILGISRDCSLAFSFDSYFF